MIFFEGVGERASLSATLLQCFDFQSIARAFLKGD